MSNKKIETLRKEQKNVAEIIQRRRIAFNFFMKHLFEMLFICFMAMLLPIEMSSDNGDLIVIVFISLLVFYICLFIIFGLFDKNKRFIKSIIYFLILIISSGFVKVAVCKFSLEQKIACFSIVILAIILILMFCLKIKDILVPVIVIVAIEIFLIYKYVNIMNGFIFVFIINLLTYITNLLNIYKSIKNGDYDKSVFIRVFILAIFVAQICSVSNILI